jgi:predicted kinase
MFVMVGLPGAGKTTRAVEIEAESPALRLTPDEWLLPLFGARIVTTERDVLEGRLIWLALRALHCGANVVLDFGVWSRDERCALRSLATSVGGACELVFLEVDERTQAARIAERQREGAASGYVLSDEDLARYRRQFEAPTAEELESDAPGPPPSGFASWASWAAVRWPGLEV